MEYLNNIINKFCENRQNVIHMLKVENECVFAFKYSPLQTFSTNLTHYFTKDYELMNGTDVSQFVLHVIILAKSPTFIEFLKNNLQQMKIINYFSFREHILVDYTQCCKDKHIEFPSYSDIAHWVLLYYQMLQTHRGYRISSCEIFDLFDGNKYLLHIFSCCIPHYVDFCKQEFIKYRAPIAMIYDISRNEQNAIRVFADEYIVSIITAFL